MSTNQEQVAQAFLAARRGEAALRDAVRTSLSRAYGPLWQSQLPDSLVAKWRQSQKYEQEAGGPVRGQELLEYATLDELAGIINGYWSAFEDQFGDLEGIQSRINTFRLFRNALMHGADLSESECRNLLSAVDDLIVACTPGFKWKPQDKAAPVQVPKKEISEQRKDGERDALLTVVTRATAQMSGALYGERDALIGYLQDNLDRCSPEALAVARERFKGLPGTEDIISSLHRRLPPVKPPSPIGLKDAAKWLNWATRFYIPYRYWLRQNDLEDSEIDAMGAMYEEWLYAHYPDLLSKPDSLVLGVYKLVKKELDNRRRVLWLIIDNLCGFWLLDFMAALEDAGIHITERTRRFSMLPSSTFISRRAMLAGRLPVDAVKFSSEEDACRQLWTEQGVPNVAFCKSSQAAEQAVGENTDLIVLLYNHIDYLAHAPDHPGFDREEDIVGAMKTLVSKVSIIMWQLQSIGPARLIVSTDHGAVWPSRSSQVVTVPPSAVTDVDFERHHRYCALQDTSGLNRVDWFVLDAKEYGLPTTYSVPRGQRFVGARPRAYTHGGLTPEETAVTVLVADVEQRDPLQLAFAQATGPLRLGRPGQLAILIRNPFGVPVENIELSIPSLGVRFEPVDVPARTEAPTKELTLTLPTSLDVDQDTVEVRLAGQYEISGKPVVVYEPLRLKVRILYKSSMDDLEDMLNV